MKEFSDRGRAALSLKLKKTIVLVGMMGAGKTAVGKMLAAYLGAPFLDSDAEIERAANMTIAEIFERDGEPFFRDRESEVISRLLDDERGVLSTGGGTFLLTRNRRLIRDKGLSVWLRGDLDLLWSRVRHKNTRPLLRTDDPYRTLKELYEQRVPLYALAGIAVDADKAYSIEDMAMTVIEALKTGSDVLEEC